MAIDRQIWIDRLYEDESLSSNLTDEERLKVLTWGEQAIEKCSNELEAAEVIRSVRRIDRFVARGGRFSMIDRLVLSGNCETGH